MPKSQALELPHQEFILPDGTKADMSKCKANLPDIRGEFQKKVDRARETLWEALPNEKDGKPFSGAYWSETVPATNVSLDPVF